MSAPQPPQRERICRQCREPSRVGKRINDLGYCRWCWWSTPAKVREWRRWTHQHPRAEIVVTPLAAEHAA